MKQEHMRWVGWVVLSILFAGAAISQSVYHNLWYDLFAPRMWLVDLAESLLLPLWIACTITAFMRFPPPRKRLWWLLLPTPWCFLRLIEFLATMLAWSLHGFAP
jgi:hypothetical protein